MSDSYSYNSGDCGYADGEFDGWVGNEYDNTMGDDTPEYFDGYEVGYEEGSLRRHLFYERIGRDDIA